MQRQIFGQLGGRFLPQHCGAGRPVNPQDGQPGAVLFVVQLNAVDAHAGHGLSVERPQVEVESGGRKVCRPGPAGTGLRTLGSGCCF